MEKADFCSAPEVAVTEGVVVDVDSAGLNPGPPPKLNDDAAGSAGLEGACPAAPPKLKPVDLGSAGFNEVCTVLSPKLKPPPKVGAGFVPSSAGLAPKRFGVRPPVLVPKAEVAGGGPAGVVEFPKLKALVVAGVVAPNSGGADVVAGVPAGDLSGVPKPVKILGAAAVGPAVVVVFCASEPVVAAGFPKLPKLKVPPPPADVFPNRLGCEGLFVLDPNNPPAVAPLEAGVVVLLLLLFEPKRPPPLGAPKLNAMLGRERFAEASEAACSSRSKEASASQLEPEVLDDVWDWGGEGCQSAVMGDGIV
jgi:hypothetical protein